MMTKTQKYHCPACKSLSLESLRNYEICDNCGWEDDPLQYDDPSLEGGANDLSITEFRKRLMKKEEDNRSS